MQSEIVIYALIGVLILSALSIMFGRELRALIMFFIRAVIGALGIFAVDFLLSPLGFAVGINLFTAAVTGILGIPGFVMLYAIAWILR